MGGWKRKLKPFFFRSNEKISRADNAQDQKINTVSIVIEITDPGYFIKQPVKHEVILINRPIKYLEYQKYYKYGIPEGDL